MSSKEPLLRLLAAVAPKQIIFRDVTFAPLRELLTEVLETVGYRIVSNGSPTIIAQGSRQQTREALRALRSEMTAAQISIEFAWEG